MRKFTFILLLFVLGTSVLMAQTNVTGHVVSADDGEPVIGASIVVKGTTVGTVSDYDGNFTLSVPSEGRTLVVSYVGMVSQEVPVASRVHVKLLSQSQDLDEVIVVAYGTAKKSSFTGSAGNMGSEKISKLQVSEVSKALEGAMAGVQVTSSSGQPGSSATIRVRGIGSISASSNPLIVVDGVPYEGALNTINPQDIESMSVLKDAASNSLYGARGANGVIMITTRKGKVGKVSLTLDNRTGFNVRGVRGYDVLDSSSEYYELYWEAMRNQQYYGAGASAYNAGQYASNNLVSQLGGYNSFNVANDQLVDPLTGRLNSSAQLLYQDNWFDEAFSAGLRQENNLSISAGSDKVSSYTSFGFLTEDSYTEQSNLKRYSARTKIDYTITDWMKAGVNLGASTLTTNAPNVGGTNSSSIFYFGQQVAPIYPVYMRDAEGNYLIGSNGSRVYDYGTSDYLKRPIGANANPIDQQANNIRESKRDVVNAKVYAQINFLKDFVFTVNVSADNFNTSTIDFQTPIGGDALNVNGRSTKSSTRTMAFNANQLLNWSRTFHDKHSFEVLLGHESKSDVVSNLSATKENFFVPTNPELDNGVVLTDASSTKQTYSLEGYFSQAKYSYRDKYYFSASYRLDGSSKFHPDSRWGSFWSVGGAWRMTQEDFMQGADYLNDLKLKASFGTQGNDNVPNSTPYKDQYTVVPQDGEIGLVYVFRGNPNLTWEKSNNFNVGFDFRLWNRFSGSVEYFYKKTWDLLYSKQLPPSQGAPSSIWENTMKMRNSGVEAELSYDIISRSKVRWNVGLNLTHYNNSLLELPEDRPQTGWATGNYLMRKGASIYNWYGFKYAGVNPENGESLFWANEYDSSGNVIGQKKVNNTNEADRYEYGKSSIPAVYGGFNTTLQYRQFDMSVALSYQIGGWAMDSQYASLMSGGTAGTNWSKDIYDRWTPENPNSNIPRLHEGSLDVNATTDRFLTSASHLSLRNVTLGYTLPGKVLSRVGIEGVRFYLVGDNLFLLSARKGFDPRQSFSGSTGPSYSAMTTYSLGFNVRF